MARKVSLEEWLAGAISDPDRPEGQGVTAFVMHHTLAGGKKGDFVHKHARGSGEWDVKKLTEILESKAAVFIQERQGRQVFRVYPFFGGKGESEGYFEFSKEREEEGVGTLTEEPDTRGQTSQTMRHNEAYASLLVSGLNQLMGNMLEHNKQLAQEASNLRHDNAQNFETMKGMVLESESRAHELRMKEMEFERTSVFYRKAMELAGPLANTLTGREIVPQSHADSQNLQGGGPAHGEGEGGDHGRRRPHEVHGGDAAGAHRRHDEPSGRDLEGGAAEAGGDPEHEPVGRPRGGRRRRGGRKDDPRERKRSRAAVRTRSTR